MLKRLFLLLFCALILGIAGCGGGGGGGNSSSTFNNTSTFNSSSSSAPLTVALTDANSTQFNSAVISIQEVDVVPVGSDPNTHSPTVIATFSPPLVVNILTLDFLQQVLGTATIAAGSYQEVRLVLSPNVNNQPPANFVTLLSDPSTQIPLQTPSDQSSGLKILGSFTVVAGTGNAIVLDFNPDKAIVDLGNSGFSLKPTGIRIVQTSTTLQTFGSISGIVSPTSSAAVVTATPTGTSTAIASTTISPDDGSFRLFVPAGSYDVTIAASGFQTVVMHGVAVTAGIDTNVGTTTLVTSQ